MTNATCTRPGKACPRLGWPTVRTLATLAAGLVAVAGAQERPKAGTKPVVTATAQIQATPLSLSAVGAAEPIQSVSVRAQVGGVITRVAFEEGGQVAAGQLLFQIDPRPLQAGLAAAQAQLARDRAQAAHAQAQAARYERLVAKDFVTREQYDGARTQAEVFLASVQADEATVEQARLNLAYASITSPITGRAGAALVKKGNVVRANDVPLVVVNQLQPIWVSFAIPGTRLPQLRHYDAAGDLEVRCTPSRDGTSPPRSGRLVFVDNAVDPRTGTVTLKAEFDNADGALWPGQFVDTELVLTVEREALTVPAVAVVAGQEGSFVYVVDADGKAAKRNVKIQRTVDGTAVLAAGLEAGEVVVTEGQMWLVPGAAVEVKADRGGRGNAP